MVEVEIEKNKVRDNLKVETSILVKFELLTNCNLIFVSL